MAQKASVSVAEGDNLQHLAHLSTPELERRRLCFTRHLMAPKRPARKRPAASSHETFCDLQPGFLSDDAIALDRRATRAATEAASRYPMPNGFSISCVCIGQPLVDDKPSPYPEDCEPNASYRFPDLQQYGIYSPKLAKAPPFDKANSGASVHPPQNGRCCVQVVRRNADFPARQLHVDFGAPMCRIVNRALTRS